MDLSIFFTIGSAYLWILNLLSFFLYGLDKYRAIHNQWRIPERLLLLLAVLGGAFGSLFAMRLFRHKTKKTKFKLLIPLLCLLWGALLWRGL